MAKDKKPAIIIDGLDVIHFSGHGGEDHALDHIVKVSSELGEARYVGIQVKHRRRSGSYYAAPEQAIHHSPPRPAPQLLLPPGTRLRSWLSFFSERSCRRIFDPIIADMQHEWQAAHEAGNLSRARWVHIFCTFHLLAALIANWLFSIWEAWKKTKLG